MKPKHLLLLGHLLTWGGVLGIALCVFFLVTTTIQIDKGGDEFALSRKQVGWGLWLFFSLFVGVVGGTALKIKAKSQSKKSQR